MMNQMRNMDFKDTYNKLLSECIKLKKISKKKNSLEKLNEVEPEKRDLGVKLDKAKKFAEEYKEENVSLMEKVTNLEDELDNLEVVK